MTKERVSLELRVRRAVDAWRALLGPRHVLTDPASVAQYEVATFETQQRILAVLRPGSVRQTQRAIAIAAKHGLPLYTVSRGRNWGYGCRVPNEDRCVVLELSRLRNITSLDDELGTVRVQAGVSFAMLAEFLRRHRSKHTLSVIGGSPGGSVLANALERGIGNGAGGQRVETLCSLEVLLATGERIETGFGRYPAARAVAVQRWGVGPSLDGLFSQSNLGVVTAATIWLQKRPAWAVTVQYSVSPARLPRALGVVRDLVATGTLRGVAKLSNWHAAVMVSGADPSLCARPPRKRLWIGTFVLSSDDRAELRAKVNHLAARLRGVPCASVTATSLSNAPQAALSALGVPSSVALRPLYFRRSEPMPADPDPRRDGCGVLFLCPVVPLRGLDVRRATGLVERCWLDAGYDPYVTLNVMDERAAHLVCGLFYDRRKPGEDARALGAYRRAFRRCLEQGYYPYRLGIQSMTDMPPAADADVMARIKHALDPKSILSPGRYESDG